jgi:hypothetical protein
VTCIRVMPYHIIIKSWPEFDLQGYQRVLEHRGKVYDIVKVSIQSYFASEQFSPADIVKWVQWFCSALGGPNFYETPIPMDGIWERKHASYEVCSYYFRFLHALTNFFKKPHGFLKSKFIIDVGSRFLQEIKDSAFDFRPPRGLFVLILTAVSALHSMHRYFLMKPMKYERVVRLGFSRGTKLYQKVLNVSPRYCYIIILEKIVTYV